MKKVCLILGIILYIFAATSYCVRSEEKITPEPPTISTYEPVDVYSNPSTVLIADTGVAETIIEPVDPRYGFTDDEVYLLAQLLCGSSTKSGDGEYDFVWKGTCTNYCEMSKVLCVVMNRVRSGSFPNTVAGVVLQKGQFSVMPKNASKTPDPVAVEKVQEWCTAYDNWDVGVQNVPENHLYFSAGPNMTNVTREKY